MVDRSDVDRSEASRAYWHGMELTERYARTRKASIGRLAKTSIRKIDEAIGLLGDYGITTMVPPCIEQIIYGLAEAEVNRREREARKRENAS